MSRRRRIDEVKNRTMKNVEKVEILDKATIKIYFKNGQDIELSSQVLDWGYDSCIVISKDNILV